MDSNKVDELLKKYWECETSLEEESTLRDYFTGSDIPERHRDAAALFRYFNQNKKKSINDLRFDEKVFKVSDGKNVKVVQLFRNSMRIAAGIAVLMAAVWFVHTELKDDRKTAIEDTYTDPKMAFEETKKALMIISKGFTKAEHEAKKINLFNEAREEIQKTDSKTQL